MQHFGLFWKIPLLKCNWVHYFDPLFKGDEQLRPLFIYFTLSYQKLMLVIVVNDWIRTCGNGLIARLLHKRAQVQFMLLNSKNSHSEKNSFNVLNYPKFKSPFAQQLLHWHTRRYLHRQIWRREPFNVYSSVVWREPHPGPPTPSRVNGSGDFLNGSLQSAEQHLPQLPTIELTVNNRKREIYFCYNVRHLNIWNLIESSSLI